MKKKKVRLKGQLGLYMRWPLFMTVLLLALNIGLYQIDLGAGLLTSVFILLYMIIAIAFYEYSRGIILRDMVQFSVRYQRIQNSLLTELSLPYVIFEEDGRILWKNDRFCELFSERKSEKYIDRVIPDFDGDLFLQKKLQRQIIEVKYMNREYEMELHRISARGFSRTEDLLHLPREGEFLVAAYMVDVTAQKQALLENENQKLLVGLIYIDNYEEIMERVEDSRQSLLAALIERKIIQYVRGVDGIAKKLENDKYFIVLRQESYRKLQANHFSILEDIKQINMGNKGVVTLSIGLGMADNDYTTSYDYAGIAMGLALARGGDQAVVKIGDSISCYGGKSEVMSQNTRVKARMKAEALREFILSQEQVLVMGHSIPDADSLGACMGIYRVAKELKKEVHIVLGNVSSSLKPLYHEIMASHQYEGDIFLNAEEALQKIGENTLVVVVDTNKAEMTECPELLERAGALAVLDHHRQGGNGIENAALSYVEPYASSASEMVAEILQYIVERVRIQTVEADCLYAGIMIDTRNFMNRTGVRTFEAAAFLRRCGANIARVRKMFREDMEAYRAKAEAVRMAEVYQKQFAITQCPGDVESPTELGAQTANELLDISGIKASFVLTDYQGKIYVSARSIDEVNVQKIAEKLGGGGHINAAGAQFENMSPEQVIDKLKSVISQMLQEGEI